MTIDVKLDQVADLFGVSFHLRFDPLVIQFIDASDGGLVSNFGADAVDFATTTNPAGRLIFGINRQTINGVATTSTSTIAHLYFHTLDIVGSTTNLYFQSNYLMDPTLTEIPSTWQNGSITVGDTQAPSIAILSPTAVASLNSSTTPLGLTGTSTDNMSVSAVTWLNDRGGSGTAVGTSDWSISNISLSSGTNILSVAAHDAAGNHATDTLTVIFDNTAPAVNITSPSSAATTSASSTSFTLSGVSSDANGVSSVTWSNSATGVSGTAVGTSSWSVPGSILSLQNGSNSVTVTAHDSFGNSSADSIIITFDNQAPSISITSPSASTPYYASSTPISLSGTASDDIAVSSISLSGGSGSISGTSSWSITGIALPTATTTLIVSAKDGLNNASTDTIVIYLDTVRPVVSTTSAASAIPASATQISIAWPAASDAGNSGLAGYRIYRDSTSTTPIATVASTTTSYADSSGLSPNTAYIYYIGAIDNAGNQSADFMSAGATTNGASTGSPGGGGSGGGGSYTQSDTTPPAQPTNFKVIAYDKKINLSWTNPTDTDFAGVLILRTSSASTSIPACPNSYNAAGGSQVYRGKDANYSDLNLDNDLKYCYAIFSYDTKPNYSSPVSISARPSVEPTLITPSSDTEQSGSVLAEKISASSSNVTTLADADSATVESVSGDEAQNIFGHLEFVNLDSTGKKLYALITGLSKDKVEDNIKRSIAWFIFAGSPTSKILGSGERAGVLSSYYSIYSRLPKGMADWQDVIKIANGRYPKEKSLKAETAAEKTFKQIYLRSPKRTANKYDNNAVSIIAYGLRPAKRSLVNETAAIKSFKYIFKRNPSRANDWDIIRAIAYSGAKR